MCPDEIIKNLQCYEAQPILKQLFETSKKNQTGRCTVDKTKKLYYNQFSEVLKNINEHNRLVLSVFFSGSHKLNSRKSLRHFTV